MNEKNGHTLPDNVILLSDRTPRPDPPDPRRKRWSFRLLQGAGLLVEGAFMGVILSVGFMANIYLRVVYHTSLGEIMGELFDGNSSGPEESGKELLF